MIAKGLLNIISLVLLQGTSFFVGIWAARLMTLGEFGALQFLRTLLGYSAFTTLGVTQAVLFELPVALGKGASAEVEAIQKLYNTLLVAGGVVSVALTMLLALLQVPLNGISLGWEWLWLGIVLALSGWTGYSQLMFQSYRQFGRLGTFRLIYPVCFALAVLVLLPRFRLNGFLFAMAIGYAALACYGLYAHRRTLGFFWSTKLFWHYVRIGLPIRLNSFVWMLITSVDLWLVSLCIGSEAAGVYGFAMLISTAYGLIPGTMAEMGMPRVSTLFGRCNLDPKPLAEPARHSLTAFAGLNVLPAILSLAAFDVIINYWVPKYRDAEPVMLLLVLGCYVNSVTGLAGNVLILLRQQRVMLLASLAVLAVVTLAGYGAATGVGTATAVGGATMAGLCLNAMVTVALIVRQIQIEDLHGFLARLGGQVLLGIAAITGSWSVAAFFSGWYKTAAFLISAASLGGGHALFGLRALKRFWDLTEVGPVVNTPVATVIDTRAGGGSVV